MRGSAEWACLPSFPGFLGVHGSIRFVALLIVPFQGCCALCSWNLESSVEGLSRFDLGRREDVTANKICQTEVLVPWATRLYEHINKLSEGAYWYDGVTSKPRCQHPGLAESL